MGPYLSSSRVHLQSYEESNNREVEIVSTKLLKLTVDLTNIPSNVDLSSKAENMAERIANQIEKMNEEYKKQANKHRRFKELKEGDLVMMYLRKVRLPAGKYNKLQSKTIGPCQIIKKFGDNTNKIDLPDKHTNQSYLQRSRYL